MASSATKLRPWNRSRPCSCNAALCRNSIRDEPRDAASIASCIRIACSISDLAISCFRIASSTARLAISLLCRASRNLRCIASCFSTSFSIAARKHSRYLFIATILLLLRFLILLLLFLDDDDDDVDDDSDDSDLDRFFFFFFA
jgi:hypothetical protein